MNTCPLLRASTESRKIAARRTTGTAQTQTGTRDNTRYWLALSASLAGWLGWRALRDVLNAIPDSNDDFGLF
ncbi:MAG TPA: hypothetical protein VEN30_02405 [Paraburkholderia sp.]|nr:hypothetical protein [Paraburkholderia sp.]